MKIRYYYLRDENKANENSKGKPVVTICLLKNDNGETARGIAYCSDKDNVSKKAGRKIAEQRAWWALVHQKSNCRIKRPHVAALNNFVKPFKAVYQPMLDTFELKLLAPKPVSGGIR